MPSPDDELDALYAAPPDGFVAARDELVRTLRERGETERATVVKQLRKPTLVAWSVNQVARTQPREVAALLEASDELRDAIARGDGDRIRSAMRKRRARVERLTDAALEHASTLSPNPSGHRDAIGSSWDAATSSEEARSTVTAGRLTAQLQPSSTIDEMVAIAPSPNATGQPRGSRPSRARAAALPRDELALRRAEDALTAAREELAGAVAIAETAEAELRDAERAATKARDAKQRAERRVERAQQTVAERRPR